MLGDTRNVEISDFVKLKYSEQVIKETLRLFPTVPYTMKTTVEEMNISTKKCMTL